MCLICGCSAPAGAAPGQGLAPDDTRSVARGDASDAALPVVDPRTGDLHYGSGAAHVAAPVFGQARAVRLEADILGANRRVAERNRLQFDAHGITALNLLSSPGSGKTTLLCATLRALRARRPALPMAVIEGDQQTRIDADRIRATGVPAVQVNTGKGCHLDASMVARAFERLHAHDGFGHGGHADRHAHDAVRGHVHDDTPVRVHAHVHDPAHAHDSSLQAAHARGRADGRDGGHGHGAGAAALFIENVGNLVCPALWDLGEAAKVAILSVTEGEDKPLKYPDMFAAARLMLLNKIDLLPHVSFDVLRCIEFARRVNPDIEVLQVSATTGEGLAGWLDWIEREMAQAGSVASASSPATVAA